MSSGGIAMQKDKFSFLAILPCSRNTCWGKGKDEETAIKECHLAVKEFYGVDVDPRFSERDLMLYEVVETMLDGQVEEEYIPVEKE